MWEYKEPKTRYLTAVQKEQVAAIFEAILPGASDAPGARDVQAVEYLDRLLATDASEYYEIRNWQPIYTAGLAMLSAASRTKYERPLEKLEVAEMTDLLTALSGGQLAGFPDEAWQKTFFSVLRNHCIEGCFSDPRWGGNKNGLMWKWFGYLQPAQQFIRAAATNR